MGSSQQDIYIEVAFATPQRQKVIQLSVSSNTTLIQAVEQSAIMDFFPDYHLDELTLGVWNKVVPKNHLVSDGDRVEIYRPLIIDPKEARRQRAVKKGR